MLGGLLQAGLLLGGLLLGAAGCSTTTAMPAGGPLAGLSREALSRCAGRPDRTAVHTTARGPIEFLYYTEESSWARDERQYGTDLGGPRFGHAARPTSPASRICRIELAIENDAVVGSRFKSTGQSLIGRGTECERFIDRCGG